MVLEKESPPLKYSDWGKRFLHMKSNEMTLLVSLIRKKDILLNIISLLLVYFLVSFFKKISFNLVSSRLPI